MWPFNEGRDIGIQWDLPKRWDIHASWSFHRSALQKFYSWREGVSKCLWKASDRKWWVCSRRKEVVKLLSTSSDWNTIWLLETNVRKLNLGSEVLILFLLHLFPLWEWSSVMECVSLSLGASAHGRAVSMGWKMLSTKGTCSKRPHLQRMGKARL